MAADRIAERMRSDRVAERMRSERLGSDRVPSGRSERISRERMGGERTSRPVRAAAPPPRGAASGRGAGHPRVSQGGRPLDPRAAGRGAERGSERGMDRARGDERRTSDRRPPSRSAENLRPRGKAAPVETGGGRLRGLVAVLGVFLVTLAGAAVDSFVGIGLGLITLVCLVTSTVFATLLVRRRDLLSVVVSPPLVFVAVAVANIALAPSAHFNLATGATLLVRGFPTMAIATGAAVVLALFRLAARR